MNSIACTDGAKPAVDWSSRTLNELVNHIVQQHHAYLQRVLPGLNRLAAQCCGRPTALPLPPEQIRRLRSVLADLTDELMQHMRKEEMVLFPWIQRLESSGCTIPQHCGTIAAPIQVMEHEHDFANHALDRLREITGGFSVEPESCDEYRTLVVGLADLQADLEQHIHEENDILFPRALELEAATFSHT